MVDKPQQIEVGDLVRYSNPIRFLTSASGNDPIGVIKELRGRSWVIVHWSDGVIMDEHIGDLTLVSKRDRHG